MYSISFSGHPHAMEKNTPSAIDRCIESLVHACNCRIGNNCQSPSCIKMKRVVAHTRQCQRNLGGSCPICKQLHALCCYHAKTCDKSNCPVYFCQKIKAKLRARTAASPSREVELESNSLKNIENSKNKEESELCLICQDFKLHVGHETKWCPSIVCKKCCQIGHAQIECMFGMENLPMPDEILLKILRYLNLGDLISCSKVSKRLKGICMDETLSYHTYHSAISYLRLQDEEIIMNVLKDKPSILETEVEVSTKTSKQRQIIFFKNSKFLKSPIKQGLLSYNIKDKKIILEVLPLKQFIQVCPYRGVIEGTDETDQESNQGNVKRLKINE